MARRVITDTQYTFSPSTRTVVIPRIVPKERLLLITNVTSNKVIYNFSDPTLLATAYSYTQNTNTTNAQTTVVLNYNTTAMNSTDQLSIVIDEIQEIFQPDEPFIDPVGKFRVSTPQAQIDTDFEYGLQPNKWETLAKTNNRPTFFINTQYPANLVSITATTGTANIVVNCFPTIAPSVGTAIVVQDATWAGANGNFVVDTSGYGANYPYNSNFSYWARTPYPSGVGNANILNNFQTQMYFSGGNIQATPGGFYSNAAYTLGSQPTIATGAGTNIVTINTVEPHGLQIGDTIFITGATTTSGNVNGVQTVTGIAGPNQLFITPTYTGNAVPSGTISGATVYPAPTGVYQHRAFDGGIQFTTSSPAHNQYVVRQTRRYFRYQAGKGIQMSTGTIMKPQINIDSLDAGLNGTASNYITVQTKINHNMAVGVTFTISGATQTAFNGTFTVDQVIDERRFTYIALTAPASTPAIGFPILSVQSWPGTARVRVGMFDTQNGFFYEYDGTTLWAVRRRSIQQLAGTVAVTNGSAVVNGISSFGSTTKFSKQITPGDYVVIKGMSYRVLDILSDTQMTVNPPYRGPTITAPIGATLTYTQEIRVPQRLFNMDRMDGTGPSGVVLDLSKMQMFYMDYSWYGAGTLRFGFRDTTGKCIYVHRFVNNNQNTEAWMRSGNLPARYEVNTLANVTTLANSMLSTDTVMTVTSTDPFAAAGTLLIANPAGIYEYVNYTGKTGTQFTGLTRGKGNTSVAGFTLTANNANITTTNSISTIQNGMYLYYNGGNVTIPNNTYVVATYSGTPNIVTLSQAPYAGNAAATVYFMNMGNVAAAHTVTSTQPIAVYQHAPAFAPTISHWGTSVIMDGQFENDKLLQFVYGEPTPTYVPPGTTTALVSLRASPAVDSGIPGTLGTREVVNRMQLNLVQCEVLTNGSFLVTLVLNGNIAPNTTAGSTGTMNNYQRIAPGTSSLAQIADHTGNILVSGGENIFGFYAVNNAGSTNYSIIDGDLTKVRELGNSILGGGLTYVPNVNVYPDGPDVLTVVAQNIGTTYANIQARLSWTEAQA